MRFHVVCQWEMMGEYDDEDDIRTRVYRCALCGRTKEKKSAFGRAAKELEDAKDERREER